MKFGTHKLKRLQVKLRHYAIAAHLSDKAHAAIRAVRPVSGRRAPLGDLEDVAGGRKVKRRVELASDRAGVVV